MPGQRRNTMNRPLSAREQALLRFYQIRQQETARAAPRQARPVPSQGGGGNGWIAQQMLGWHPRNTLQRVTDAMRRGR